MANGPARKSGDDAPQKGKLKEVNRGTQDEMEVLMLILRDNQVLRQNVLEKLRFARQRQERRQRQAKPSSE